MRIIIPHCEWLYERKATLRRLLDQLTDATESPIVLASKHREHASVWAGVAWDLASEFDDHVCILNDDVILHPEFLPIVEAMIAAVPDECISLHTNAPGAAAGYDHHPHRVPTVPVRECDSVRNLTDPAYWEKSWNDPWIDNPWMPVERMAYMRTVLQVGRAICFLCATREGVAGNVAEKVMLCEQCLTAIDAARRGAT